MRIVFDGMVYALQSSGGISRMYNEIIPRLVELDPRISIEFLVTRKLLQPLPVIDRAQIHDVSAMDKFLRPRRIWRSVSPQIKEIAGRLRLGSSKHKIWHSTYFTNIPVWHGPKVATVYDMVYEQYPELFPTRNEQKLRDIKKKAVLHSDVVICISQTTRLILAEQYPNLRSRIEVIYPGVSILFTRIEKDKIPEQYEVQFPFLLFVGRRDRHKNFIELLTAYSQWPMHHEIKLLVVGARWEPDESRLIEDFNLEEQVVLLNGVSDLQLLSLYNQARAFVYPSLYEGFGIPLLEAMACGCPMIASRIPTSVEVAQEIPNYYTIGSQDELIERMTQCARNEGQASRIQQGLERVKDFSWDASVHQLYRLYQDLSS